MKINRKLALVVSMVLITGTVCADEHEELVRLRATTLNLIDMLVEEGVFSREKADQLVKRAEQAAEKEIEDATVAREVVEEPPKDTTVVRVPYVPDFVKDEIRAEVREELREDVVADVKDVAREERWGTPDALPDWLSRISLHGDIRLRYQGDYFSDSNREFSYFDWQEINDSGGLSDAGSDAFLNVTDNDDRFRERLRLGLDAQVNDSIRTGVRLTTGNTNNPVSTNQTLGDYNNRWEVVLDHGYLQYDWQQETGPGHDPQSVSLVGGRFANPFFHTDLVWDSDVSMEGVSATWNSGFGESSWNDHYLPSVFVSAGGFMLEDINESNCDDKWMFGAQVGGEWAFYDGRSDTDDSSLKIGLAYYDYKNIEGEPNKLGSRQNDCSAPKFMQKGNSVIRISNDIGELPGDPRLVGLAGDYDILNLTAEYDHVFSDPMHLILTADYARNIGFDKDDIEDDTGVRFRERTDAYQVRAALGSPKVRRPHEWQVFAGYKRIEADAVLDAFNDSDFHLGGTDAKGWFIGGSYGLLENTWLSARWMSTDEIDGNNGTGSGSEKLGVDTLQIDLNSRF
jgi:hypothetical protein